MRSRSARSGTTCSTWTSTCWARAERSRRCSRCEPYSWARPDIYAQHVTQTRTLPAASTQIRVIERYEAFDPVYHTASCKLLTGAGFGTQVSPSSVSTYIDPDDGAYERTYVFNLGAAVTQYRVLTRIDTSTNQRVFHVGWQKDYAL